MLPLSKGGLPKLVTSALWIAAAWFVVAIVSSLRDYMSAVAHGEAASWSSAWASSFAWFGSWAILTPFVVWLAIRFAPGKRSILSWLAIHGLGVIVTAMAHSACYALLTSPLGSAATAEVFLRLLSHGLTYALLYFVIIGLVLGARAQRALRDREIQAAQLQARLAEAETATLRAQLQPHFLFNTLNAISALVPNEPVTAQRLIARLGDLLRLSIDENHGPQSCFADELEFTNLYLAIEEARLGERLRIVRRIAPDALLCAVPTMLLQPLVENAVRHGIAPVIAGGTLTIEAVREGDQLRICVADDGKGEAVVEDGVGLGNSRARLQHIYGNRHSFDVVTAPDRGFKVTIRVPA